MNLPAVKKLLHRLGHVFVIVIHDKTVDRAARQLAVLLAVRLLLAAGASAELVQIIQRLAPR